uniref:Uncharacterized protein n=1 Tax=Rhizophora mucronata TaxID=61149 RepID=A0A2P2PMJ5_RHIMU
MHVRRNRTTFDHLPYCIFTALFWVCRKYLNSEIKMEILCQFGITKSKIFDLSHTNTQRG